MNDANIAAIISASAVITGVILSNVFTAIKEKRNERQRDERDNSYLAILVVSHLERFANGCWNVALDDGTSEGEPAGKGGERHHPTVYAPEFSPIDLKVEWKALPAKIMYEIFQISDKKEQLENRLGHIWDRDDPPEYTEYFWERQRKYAELGLHVSAVTKVLRRHANLPVDEGPMGESNREVALIEIIDEIDTEIAAHEKRQMALNNEIFTAFQAQTSEGQ